ncbi:hypothetical protein [Rufibacter sp. XAAS-G3-1]|uniref:hypothetical protein n=1 Tax=Rufibacter sp. XAAS-G3-1 TaxID=2729134 RepID=UPI0015E7D1EA|nr:hypothetical protein [Rufibacter sp. XAAS-G3-1]
MNLLNWLHFPVFFFLVYLLWRSARNETMRRFFWPALILKLTGGVLLGLVYQRYLGGRDTWGFHDQAMGVVEAASHHPEQYFRLLFFNEPGEIPIGFARWPEYSNSFFFIKLLSLLYFMTGHSYWFSGLYLSVFSFWGCWFLVEKLNTHFPAYGTASAIAFLFFPSVVFWTSGVSKDSVFMGSLCLTAGLFLQVSPVRHTGNVLGKMLLLGGSTYLLWKIKFFLAAVLLVLLFAWLLMEWLTPKAKWWQTRRNQFLAWGTLLLLGSVIASFAHPTFNLDFFARHIVWNYKSLIAVSDPANPLLSFPNLQPTLTSVFLHAPSAILQMLFRPFLWEPSPVVYKGMAFENLLLLGLVGLTFVHLLRRREVPALPSFLAVLLVFFCISAVLVTLPTPNLGSLHRYRAPLLPFFLLVVLAWGPVPAWLKGRAKRLR